MFGGGGVRFFGYEVWFEFDGGVDWLVVRWCECDVCIVLFFDENM